MIKRISENPVRNQSMRKRIHESADYDLAYRAKKLIKDSNADVYELEDDIWLINSDRHGFDLILFDKNRNVVYVKHIGAVSDIRRGVNGDDVELCTDFGEFDWAVNL